MRGWGVGFLTAPSPCPWVRLGRRGCLPPRCRRRAALPLGPVAEAAQGSLRKCLQWGLLQSRTLAHEKELVPLPQGRQVPLHLGGDHSSLARLTGPSLPTRCLPVVPRRGDRSLSMSVLARRAGVGHAGRPPRGVARGPGSDCFPPPPWTRGPAPAVSGEKRRRSLSGEVGGAGEATA